MSRSLSTLLVAALLGGIPGVALAESIGSNGGPAGGAFMSSYSNPAPRFSQAPAPAAYTTQSSSAAPDVAVTASTRRDMKRPRR